MYNSNDTITQGQTRIKQQKKHEDKGINFKSIAAASFAGAMAGAGAMWAGEALANEQEHATTTEGTTAGAAKAETPTIAQPTEQEVTANTLSAESKAQQQHESAATPKAHTTEHASSSHTSTHHDEPHLTPATHTQGYAAQHDIQIESVETMTTDDGRTINMAIGTVDGHMAAFQMDDNNRVVASFVDRNDNGEIDDNEVTDLRSEHMTLNTLTNGNTNVQMTTENNDDTGSPEIHVIAVQNDVDLNGHSVDVAHVSVGDEHVALVDVTQNGEADVMIADSNHNGLIDGNELHDISDSHIPMPSTDDVEGGYGQMTQSDTDLPDYSNDADITLYDV